MGPGAHGALGGHHGELHRAHGHGGWDCRVTSMRTGSYYNNADLPWVETFDLNLDAACG